MSRVLAAVGVVAIVIAGVYIIREINEPDTIGEAIEEAADEVGDAVDDATDK